LKQVETNLRAGRLRLLFVADQVPPELRRVVEFLNEQMTGVEVLAIEVHQYVERDGDRRILVPTTIGDTEAARGRKSTTRRVPWTEEDLLLALESWKPPEIGARLTRLYRELRAAGAEARWGRGQSPGVTLWLGRSKDPSRANPVSISIYTGEYAGIAINFDTVRPYRSEEEMRRLARLMLELPGVASYVAGVEEQEWRMHRGMDAGSVLPNDGAVEQWVVAVREASRRPDGESEVPGYG
jgi:hypothetical protein